MFSVRSNVVSFSRNVVLRGALFSKKFGPEMGDVFGLVDLCSRAVTTSDPELSLDLLPKFLCAWHSSAAAITLWNTVYLDGPQRRSQRPPWRWSVRRFSISSQLESQQSFMPK